MDENRKHGAAKAAATRCRKRESKQTNVNYHCGICGMLFEVQMNRNIGLGVKLLMRGFMVTVGITPENEPDKSNCSVCVCLMVYGVCVFSVCVYVSETILRPLNIYIIICVY